MDQATADASRLLLVSHSAKESAATEEFTVVFGPIAAGDGFWSLVGMEKDVSAARMRADGEWWLVRLSPPK